MYLVRERERKRMKKMVQEETRKGPWTEQEDLQLVCFVRLFGQQRWDFIAKVSGLNRTGKSCRLRWVNYLHPGLKRGRMTPQEERIVLELHSRWGNRWSRIARKLPGRTDNEIKNYWRTHMRKTAQERKQMSLSSSPSSSSSIAKSQIDEEGSLHDGGCEEEVAKGYSMDQIWKEIEVNTSGCKEEGCNFSSSPIASPLWDYCSDDSLWKMDEEERSRCCFLADHFVSKYEHGRES